MDELQVPSVSTLVIGDTTHDLQMAANPGVDEVALTHGAHSRDDLEGLSPLACVDNIRRLGRCAGTKACDEMEC